MLEYFISTHGARKGLADTALRTADSGYLTRRLVDVAQDVIVRAEDCKTKDFIEMPLLEDDGQINDNLIGPPRGEEVRDQARPRAAEAQPGDRRPRAGADRRGLRRRAGRSRSRSARCSSARPTPGSAAACYGRALATGAMVEIGDAVGIIAAQSIGEPGTQLTMRTFHTGGVAGQDITQGLPRVVELFEARKPKGLAQMAEVDGKVSIEETDKALKVIDHRREGRGARLQLPAAHAPARQARPAGRGRHPAQRGLALPGRAARHPRPHRDRAVPRRRGPGGLQGPGRRHQRQAHRADRPPDAEEGAGRLEGLDHAAARPARGPPQASSGSTSRSRTTAARRPRARR